MVFRINPEKKALRFVEENGPSLAAHIAYNCASPITKLKDSIWASLKITKQEHLFFDAKDAINVFIFTFLAIRIDLEMRAVNRKFGPTINKKLAFYISEHCTPIVGDIFPRLMKDAYETIEENKGQDMDIILSELCNKMLDSKEKISPALFYPFRSILTEGGNLIGIIEENM